MEIQSLNICYKQLANSQKKRGGGEGGGKKKKSNKTNKKTALASIGR